MAELGSRLGKVIRFLLAAGAALSLFLPAGLASAAQGPYVIPEQYDPAETWDISGSNNVHYDWYANEGDEAAPFYPSFGSPFLRRALSGLLPPAKPLRHHRGELQRPLEPFRLPQPGPRLHPRAVQAALGEGGRGGFPTGWRWVTFSGSTPSAPCSAPSRASRWNSSPGSAAITTRPTPSS